MIKRYIIITLLVASMLFGFALPAFAIDDPDVPPAINFVGVYEDCLQDGDIGVFIDETITYTTNPDENVTDAYMVVFVDTDGITQLKTVAPYTFDDDGYGRGNVWMRFTPAEVAAYGITEANMADYEIWLVGNPALAWTGDPPKTIAGIDYWQPDGTSTSTLLGLRVLQYADILELAWVLDMIEDTPLGNKLTENGEAYYTNVITDLRTMAPAVFASGEYNPTIEDIDYSTSFNATMTDGTGTIAGSPVQLVEGAQTVTILAGDEGTFVLWLNNGVTGTFEDDTGTVTGSPLDLVPGTNTVTVTAAGDFTVTLTLTDTSTILDDLVIGTGFDLTDVATAFGMTRWTFSGLVWVLVSIIICASIYGLQRNYNGMGQGQGGKVVMLVLDVCLVGGTLLGLLHPLLGSLMFIAYSAFIGYILFFRHANV